MFFERAVLVATGLALFLIIASAGAQTADSDRQAVRADQQALDDAYHQLAKDRKEGNAAGIQIDQNNIDTAEQDFRTDEERTITDDQKAIAEDQRILDGLNQQLQLDQRENAGAVAADENNINAAVQKLKTDKQQIVADDSLEITRDQQALDTENEQLQMDLRSGLAVVGGPTDTVQADEESVKEATKSLQSAQLKLQLDQGNQNLAP